MTERNDDFLQRWSRRKQAATADAKRAKDEPQSPPAPVKEDKTADDAAFDPATLPPVDSITAISDIRDFLKAGVPAELTRAALRRAWSADPAIRDFIGLAENSWDFTAPDAIPGFGPLNASPDEIRQLVDQIINRTSDLAEAEPPAPAAGSKSVTEQGVQPEVSTAPQVGDPSELPQETVPDTSGGARPVNVALQQDEPGGDDQSPRPRRSRGGALPR